MDDERILHYQIVDRLSSGGMGVVFRAVDTRLDRLVALKFLPEETARNPTARQRLVAEAKSAAKLDHPNIGVIHSIEEPDEQPFIVMALYRGRGLEQRIADGPLGSDEARAIALQVARGLAVAHEAGIVHRDIKPANIFLTEQNLVKILDFGLAKQDDMSGLTTPGTIVGTLEYMSPEQVRGQPVDRRTDLWSFGVVLYEMLSGVSPFKTEGGVAASILRIIKEEPVHLSELGLGVPERLAAVVMRALAKETEERYGSAQEMIAELEAASGSVVLAPPAPALVVPPEPQAAAPPPRAVRAPPSSSVVPRARSPLVGRADELSILTLNLEDPDCQVLTLFGPGGTGKTRLVTEVAQRELEAGRFPDGVFFVALDPLEDADLIPATIAGVIGLDLQGQEPALDQLLRHIGDHAMLLVLDNYEHVMDGAYLPSELVQGCPNLKILVTSRERLTLEEEWILPVTGLAIPEVEHESVDDAERFDSVLLFVHRAKRANLRFSLADEDPAQVCRICRLVAGSPLGIELAAAWVKMMPCHEIASEIQGNIDFLESSSRNVNERHRSIRACFEYSWKLLDAKEQEVLSRLSVFQGGFTREAASEVAGGSLPVLMSLLDKSLLHADGSRYANHPLLRQYSTEKLRERPDEQARVEGEHSGYYLRYLQACSGGKDDLEKLDVELANVLAAMSAASQRGDDAALVEFMRLLALDGGYYAARGHTPRSLELLRQAIAAAKRLEELLLAHGLLAKLGNAYKLALGDLGSALEAYGEALELAEQLVNDRRIAILLSTIGQTRFEQGADDADDYLERAYEVAQRGDDALALNHVLYHQGFLAGSREDWPAARQLFHEALEVLAGFEGGTQNERTEGDYRVFMGLLNLGEAERVLGNHAASLELRQRALAMAEERDNRLWRASANHELGEVYHGMGEREKAGEVFLRALKLWRQSNVAVEIEKLEAFMVAEGYRIGTTTTQF